MPSLADAHAALLRNGALQFDRPAAQAPEPQPDGWHFTLGLGHVDLVWIVAGAVAVAVVVAVLIYLKDRPAPRAAAEPPRAPEPALSPVRVRMALADGDRLAADGRFLEAARALLASGVGFIADHHPRSLLPTSTSRDIAGDAALPAPLRAAFGRIAALVEIGLFGGRPVGAEDYAECRRVFLASALAQAA